MVNAPIAKLPLMSRKEIRDKWDTKKPEYDQKLSSILDGQWQFTFDPALIYANCDREDLLNRLSEAVGWYVEEFLKGIESWSKDKAGPHGKADLDRVAGGKTVNVKPQGAETKFNDGGIFIDAGIMNIVYAEGKFGNNVYKVVSADAIQHGIDQAMIAADGGSTSLTPDARRDIEKYYEPKIEPVRAKIGELVNIPDITIDPNFEEVCKRLAAGGEERSVKNVGQAVFAYFQNLQGALEKQKFGGDDMLQEAFGEAVSGKKVGLRIVDKYQSKTYNEVTIEDGVLWIDVTVARWWENVNRVGEGLVDLL